MQGSRRRARRPVAIVQAPIAMAGLAITRTAVASSPFQVLEPADYMLSFHQVVRGVPTPTKRVLLRNFTPDPASGDARCGGPDFTWSANTPVHVGPGLYVAWEIACNTNNPAAAQQWFDLDWCGVDCDSRQACCRSRRGAPILRSSSGATVARAIALLAFVGRRRAARAASATTGR